MTDKTGPPLLLINPWIDDFAAYDFWAKPLGLLSIAGILRMHGYHVDYIDCLDRFHPEGSGVGGKGEFGKGPYAKTPLSKPEGLFDIPRQYSRYGLPEPMVRRAIEECPVPEAVLVTCVVTYWYPGLVALIQVVREMLPGVPIILGGIYATLCHDHAVDHAGADTVFPGHCAESLLEHLGQLTGNSCSLRFSPDQLDTYPHPAFDLQSHISYIPILTGEGCPFRCTYCASGFLNPRFRRRSPESVIEEIACWHEKYSVLDFAFYDDALLVDADRHIALILEGVLSRGLAVRFHTPNALHVRPLSRDVASLMFRSGFKTIRLGLETAFCEDRQALDDKVGPGEYQQAVHNLRSAGFGSEAMGAYLLYGLPGQDLTKLEASIETVKASGVRPVLAQYSPIPHTALWPSAVKASRYDLAADPIFHNNSIFPCQHDPFSWEKIAYFKGLTQE